MNTKATLTSYKINNDIHLRKYSHMGVTLFFFIR